MVLEPPIDMKESRKIGQIPCCECEAGKSTGMAWLACVKQRQVCKSYPFSHVLLLLLCTFFQHFACSLSLFSSLAQLIIWDVAKGEAMKRIECHVDTIYCVSWNFNGSLLATTSKDKKIRVIDPREGFVRQVRQSTKQRCSYSLCRHVVCGDGNI